MNETQEPEKPKPRTRLDREQKIGLSNVLVGFTIAGGLTIFNYLGGQSNLSVSDISVIALVTSICLVVLIWLRKE